MNTDSNTYIVQYNGVNITVCNNYPLLTEADKSTLKEKAERDLYSIFIKYVA